ncbi:MAG: diaminopimelate decarboxylase [Chitinispirillaceae bacterium]|nr:diaminopimelate decarboxylase [Chitinispirillaceae bacterium]
MTQKTVPFTRQQIERIIQKHPTPFHIYDEKGMRENARSLVKAFSWAPGFKEFFAVKAAPNPYLMRLFKNEGMGADCSSLPELLLAQRCTITGEEIMFSSNNTPADEMKLAKELGAVINLDDITHIRFLEEQAGLPEVVCFRYNPGPLRTGNAIIGDPQESKYGFTRGQLFEGYGILKEKGIRRFGLHTMIVSNELNPDSFIETAAMLYDLVIDLHRELDINFEFVNIGGGIGIPYRPEQEAVDLAYVSDGIRKAYDRTIKGTVLHPLKLFMECGRIMTGPYGFLVSRVLHLKQTYKQYVGLDASMADLMRPAIYNAYHHITVLGKEAAPHDRIYDVTGSLCENNDKFAVDRKLPAVEEGDIVVIHDTGAHGHAMGFNYNGKLRSAELLLRENGDVLQIRRAETVEDYFATLDFSGLDNFK